MSVAEEIRQLFVQTNTCVIIPTYNNHKTLRRVIDNSLLYTDRIIIVNDGSTDSTREILGDYPQLKIIHLEKNQGKGNGIRTGFKKAKEQGYQNAITIDSDGQHFPEDFIAFLREIREAGEPVLLIGSRNMDSENVPKKSSFGNKFSNFWFKVETGIKLNDTQSGFRSYPLNFIPKRFFTKKFEFEIEVIVRTAWKGIQVKNIPIKILYDPSERVSHFRPFKDFTRISILNTVLVLITFLYIHPRNFLRSFKKKSFKNFIKENILQADASNLNIALSIGLGLLIGLSPLWGFHTFLAIFLPHVLKLNKALSFAASNISIPPMIPFIIIGSLYTGSVFTGDNAALHLPDKLTVEYAKNHLTTYLIGSSVLAIFVSTITASLIYLILLVSKRK